MIIYCIKRHAGKFNIVLFLNANTRCCRASAIQIFQLENPSVLVINEK